MTGSASSITISASSGATCNLTECINPGEATLTCGATSVTVVCIVPPIFYEVGDPGPAGGIVFHITDGGLHGLEAAPIDQSSGQWGCLGVPLNATTGGAASTANIIAKCPQLNIAARIADGYSLNGFDDWFLPSQHELSWLSQQKVVVGGFADDYYWSSSQYDFDSALFVNFDDKQVGWQPKDSSLRVRAVRAF